MGRQFLLENSGASTILVDSPLKLLAQLNLHRTKLDQCMYGAMMEGTSIKKNSMFISNRVHPWSQ